jgi:predicted metal-dependent hydrolase
MMSDPALCDHLEHGIRLFNDGEYFECHEVLELAWTPERGPRRLFLQSLIHVAVGLYHAGRGNPVGAARQLRKALRKLGAYLPAYEGVDTGRLHRDASKALERIEAGGAPAEIAIHRTVRNHPKFTNVNRR